MSDRIAEREALAQIREWAEEVGVSDPVYIDHLVDILNEFQVGERVEVSETGPEPMSEVGATFPEGLCGASYEGAVLPDRPRWEHCVFLPLHEGKHSWEK